MSRVKHRSIKINVTQGPVRLDLALLSFFKNVAPHLTRRKLQDLLTQGAIHLLGESHSKPSRVLEIGTYDFETVEDLASLLLDAKASSAEKSFLPIVYEDPDLLVLHKASGIPSMPHSAEETQTAVGSALAHFPDLPAIEDRPFEPGLLHRLDTGTSGLLVFAKTLEEFQRMRAAWKRGEAKKIYRALAPRHAALPPLPFEIKLPLAHDAHSPKKMIALRPDSHYKFRGKPLPAKTRILRDHSKTLPGKNLDLEIEITTGVMHQIRCHLAAIRVAILGDPIYRGETSSRLWLHAWKLELPLASGNRLNLEARLPDSWNQN